MNPPIDVSSVLFTHPRANALAPIRAVLQLRINAPFYSAITCTFTFVGSAKSQAFDQVLNSFQIGPFPSATTMQLDLIGACPNYDLVPKDELNKISALILSFQVSVQEFIRIGYYVYFEPVVCQPTADLMSTTNRVILTQKPRIYRFPVSLPLKVCFQKEVISDVETKGDSVSTKQCQQIVQRIAFKSKQIRKSRTGRKD